MLASVSFEPWLSPTCCRPGFQARGLCCSRQACVQESIHVRIGRLAAHVHLALHGPTLFRALQETRRACHKRAASDALTRLLQSLQQALQHSLQPATGRSITTGGRGPSWECAGTAAARKVNKSSAVKAQQPIGLAATHPAKRGICIPSTKIFVAHFGLGDAVQLSHPGTVVTTPATVTAVAGNGTHGSCIQGRTAECQLWDSDCRHTRSPQ